MPFQIHALAYELFAPLFALPDRELSRIGAARMIVDAKPGYPCRVSLVDAEIGETVILVNFVHQPADCPYRASHAIFVRAGARQAQPPIDAIPEVLSSRLISLRAFDRRHYMIDADVAAGAQLSESIEAMLAAPAVEYLHLHNAKPGCYAARVTRA